MDKKWYDIPGYEGLYQINDDFDIYSSYCQREIKQYTLVRHGIPYKFVSLSKNGRRKTMYIHRIVASVFIPNPLSLREVDHIDGNSLNNSISNLRWCTSKENAANPITAARKKMNSAKTNGIPVEEISAEGDVLCFYHSCRDAGRAIGISHIMIKKLCELHEASTNGHFFRFASAQNAG